MSAQRFFSGGILAPLEAKIELKFLKTNLSGPSLVNEVSSVIPAIVKFIKTNVEISDDNNEWIERS